MKSDVDKGEIVEHIKQDVLGKTQFTINNDTARLLISKLKLYSPTESYLTRVHINFHNQTDNFINNFIIYKKETEDEYIFTFDVEYLNNDQELIDRINDILSQYKLIMVSPNLNKRDDNSYAIVSTNIWFKQS